ncbi:hypothetical protein PMAYCL1PPCAC_19083, partial [Pristionchus mayeri]
SSVLCLVTLPSHVKEANDDGGRHICDCHPPCIEHKFLQTVTYGVYPSEKYNVGTGTQDQRDLLLRGMNGGRRGSGKDEDDDYDGTTTTTTSTTSRPATSMITMKPYVPPPPMCPGLKLSAEDAIKIGVIDEICRHEYSFYYEDPRFTVIQGWPCLSTKRCKTCVMFAAPPPIFDWPCIYTDYESCTQYNKQRGSKYTCDKFFSDFDFIPTSVNIPNIKNWDSGALPSSSTCTQHAPASKQRLECFDSNDCVRVPSSSNLTRIAGTPLLDRAFWLSANVIATTTPCDLARAALNAAHHKLGLTGAGGTGRKKRSALASTDSSTTSTTRSTTTTPAILKSTTATPAENVTVDLPGYGSCEYANLNFKGSSECIKWYQRNGLIFEMYYESLEVHSYTQIPTYTLVAMLSDVAGHAGLWLGISIISIVEFIALFFLCCIRMIRGKNMVAVSEEEARRGGRNKLNG